MPNYRRTTNAPDQNKLARMTNFSWPGAQDSEGVSEMGDEKWAKERAHMVETQVRARGIRHEGVLASLGRVPRHEFVGEVQRDQAYHDHPLPIGHGQTISQPYMVAVMTEALQPHAGDDVLEVGTGSGYQAAVLAGLVAAVTSVEWVPELAERARLTLDRLGVDKVRVLTGDGSLGVTGRRFDAIIVTAGAERVPPVLLAQLADGGRLVMPRGTRRHQTLTIVRRAGTEFKEEQREGCVFVPLQGPAGWDG